MGSSKQDITDLNVFNSTFHRCSASAGDGGAVSLGLSASAELRVRLSPRIRPAAATLPVRARKVECCVPRTGVLLRPNQRRRGCGWRRFHGRRLAVESVERDVCAGLGLERRRRLCHRRGESLSPRLELLRYCVVATQLQRQQTCDTPTLRARAPCVRPWHESRLKCKGQVYDSP